MLNAAQKTALRKAIRLINSKNWIQGTLALDKTDRIVSPKSKRAVRWCAEGALRKYCSKSRVADRLLALYEDKYVAELYDFNDRGRMTADKVKKHLREFLHGNV